MEGVELRMRTGRFDGDVGSLICLDWFAMLGRWVLAYHHRCVRGNDVAR